MNPNRPRLIPGPVVSIHDGKLARRQSPDAVSRHRKRKNFTLVRAVDLRARGENWLGRQDSNLGMSVPKTDALPLGDAPISPRGRIYKKPPAGGSGPDSAFPQRWQWAPQRIFPRKQPFGAFSPAPAPAAANRPPAPRRRRRGGARFARRRMGRGAKRPVKSAAFATPGAGLPKPPFSPQEMFCHRRGPEL